MTRGAPFRLRLASLPSPRGRRACHGLDPKVGDEGAALAQPFGVAKISSSLCSPHANLVKRFSRLPARESLFCPHRKVTKRCDPMACRPHGEAVRVRKRWPGSAEGTSCAAAKATRSLAWPASGFSVQHLPTGAGGWIRRKSNRRESAALLSASRCVPLTYLPIRGGELAQESPQGGRMDSASSLPVQGCAFSEPRSQLAQSCGFIARPTRQGRIFWLLFCASRKVTRCAAARRDAGQTLAEAGKQKDSAGGSPAKRLTRLAAANGKARRGSRTIRLTSLATAIPSRMVTQGPDLHFRHFSRGEKEAIGSATAQHGEGRG